jgi:hypothetical protein
MKEPSIVAGDILPRVAVLERIAADTATVLADIRTDIRAIRADMRRDFRWLLSIMLGGIAITIGGFISLLTIL